MKRFTVRKTAWSVALLLLTLISGCATLHPIPVNEPALNAAQSFDQLVSNLNSLETSYKSDANRLKSDDADFSDVATGAGLFAVGGIIDKARRAFNVGVLTAAGATYIPQRYQVAVQAANYESARKKIHCILSESQQFPISPDHFTIDNDAALEITRGMLYVTGNRAIAVIQEELRAAQWAVALIAPDVTKLKNALSKFNAVGAPPATVTMSAKPASTRMEAYGKLFGSGQVAAALDARAQSIVVNNTQLLAKLVKEYEAVINTCATAGTTPGEK